MQAEQIENIEKCNALKKNMEENVQKSHVWQRDVDTLKHNLFLSFSKVIVPLPAVQTFLRYSSIFATKFFMTANFLK